ncbi:hypothetical protein, partial [Pseudomonas sp. Bi70]|uniref:hypothetical protein n=1 Tax=Pseudomonas sp. Bi70 TaxID=2821127 RepID=UPI001E6230F8
MEYLYGHGTGDDGQWRDIGAEPQGEQVAVSAPADFISRFMQLILAMMIVLVPWAVINLADFYLVQK